MQKFECLRCGNCCRNLNKEDNSYINLPCFKGNKLLLLSTSLLTMQDWEKGFIPCRKYSSLPRIL